MYVVIEDVNGLIVLRMVETIYRWFQCMHTLQFPINICSHVHMLCINAPSFHVTQTDFHSMAYYHSFSILRWMVDIHSFFGDALEQLC